MDRSHILSLSSRLKVNVEEKILGCKQPLVDSSTVRAAANNRRGGIERLPTRADWGILLCLKQCGILPDPAKEEERSQSSGLLVSPKLSHGAAIDSIPTSVLQHPKTLPGCESSDL